MSQSISRGGKSVPSDSAPESVEPVEPAQPTVVEPEENRAENQAGTEGSSAEAGSSDDAPTVNLDDESQGGRTRAPDSEVQDVRQPVEETQESSGTAAEVDQSTGEAAAADESAGPVAEADAEPVAVQPAAAEPVETPVSVDVVDAAATPAEVLSPYDSPHDQTGADVSVSAGRGAVWSPDSGDMPPSITPKSLSGASPSSPEQSTPRRRRRPSR